MVSGVFVVANKHLRGALGGGLLRAMALLAAALLAGCLLATNARAAPYSGMAVDANTGKVLYSSHADSPRYPASLTKIMTLYLLFDYIAEGKIDYTTDFVVTKHAAGQSPSKLGLKPGKTIRVIDAIRALVTKSANDVAVVVAENIAGSEVNFAKMMTQKARAIGMKSTTFRNASGLPNAQQMTTARDMITLAIRIQRDHPEHYKFFATKQFVYQGRRYRSHNGLLYSYKGTDGIKTGYTRASGFNLVSSVRRGDKHVVAVVMGGRTAGSRNAQMGSILDRAIKLAVAVKRRRPAPPLPHRKPEQSIEAPALLVSRRGPAGTGGEPRIPPEELAQIEEALAEERRRGGVSRTAAISQGDTQDDGGFHVQVGAYKSPADAGDQLAHVQSVAGDLLAGHDALTVPYRARSRPLYRARFAGFSEAAARAACSRLKSRSINCVVMRAD